ncbi:MAG TPA: carboxypeptidase-like regulatory domain-containing protein [Bacteroidia bacterium]|nr:carboxypeptidase-like regulatory domain-containing protein [Bacteroidia bacterium]
MKRIIYILIFTVFIPFFASAQKKAVAWQDGKHDLVQFSGVVVEGDSLKPIPYTSIIVQNGYRGTVSDYFGYFSFVAQEGDTLEFSAIGFQSAFFIIPDTLTNYKYSLIQVLKMDTISLPTTDVYPWPTKEQFKKAFLALELPEDDITRADRNMARSDSKERMTGMAMDASLNYKYSMQQYQSKLYYAGQLPPNNLLNPIAWAKFIKAWKNGDFKKKN